MVMFVHLNLPTALTGDLLCYNRRDMYEIDFYANEILRNQLGGFGVRGKALNRIVGNIIKQLRSAIRNWNGQEFRGALLTIGSEEGTFYSPDGGDVNNLVVVAVRNSYLEKAGSVDCITVGLTRELSSSQMREITVAAIEYFMKVDLGLMADKMDEVQDVYRSVADKYPVAWRSLMELGRCTSDDREHSYEPELFDAPFVIDGMGGVVEGNGMGRTNVENGISGEFDAWLLGALTSIADGKLEVLYTDSFKFLTRNFEKLLKVLEVILTHGGWFATGNYLMRNGYVSRRRELMKAAHTDNEMRDKLVSVQMVSDKHVEMLIAMREGLLYGVKEKKKR